MRTKTDEGWGKLKRGTAKALAKVEMGCNETRVVHAIIYKTICFNKISDIIPLSQLEDLTGIERRNMKRAINSLLIKKVIWRKDSACGLCKRFLNFEGVSLSPQPGEGVSLVPERGVTSIKKSVDSDTLIRSSHKNIHNKVLSNHQDKNQLEENKKNVSVILKNLANMKGMK